MKFVEWMKIREARLASKLRPDIDPNSAKRLQVSIGDVVELGPESEHMGKKVNRVGQVIEIRADNVVVRDLTKDNKKYIISFSDLYDKEELKGILLTPSEERDLKMLGGKRLWVRLSPRQYKKFKSQYQVKMTPIIPEPTGEAPSTVLRQMFSKSSASEPAMKIFEPDSPKPSSPLKRFIRKDLF